ncbi:MAG: helix-hairpin-helix domain-containing protein [Candidatus Omnitrophota bacterium]
MFDLTQEEKKVILFLLVMAFLGLGINFLIKFNCRIQRIAKPQAEKVKLNVNIVTFEELTAAKLINKRLAQGIIDYRNTNGPFRSIDDLDAVKGVGEYRLQKLKELLFAE